MKKLLVLVAIVFAISANAQEKVAYLDLYQRGGGLHLTTTLLYNDQEINMGVMTIGKALNLLSDKGWVVKETILPRRGNAAIFTRHKFHVILEKRYNEGENPFEGLDDLDTDEFNEDW